MGSKRTEKAEGYVHVASLPGCTSFFLFRLHFICLLASYLSNYPKSRGQGGPQGCA